MKTEDLPKKTRKRNGIVVAFKKNKILNAIKKAVVTVTQDKNKADRVASQVTEIVLDKLRESYGGKTIGVEDIQDIVESTLMNEGYSQIAKAYILYRQKRSDVRAVKSVLGLKDDLKLSLNSLEVLKKRYLLKDDNQDIMETPGELIRRVAYNISLAEENFKSRYKRTDVEEKFHNMMKNLEFMPNSPTLMNAGTSLGQLSACFVLPVYDSIDGIFDALHSMAKIHQSGGGTGFDFSHLRPRGDVVNSTKGEASGPVSFMSIFDSATDVIVQGGRRRGANMGILRCDHPDIVEFVEAKREGQAFSNFNLSVGITDSFMEAVKKNKRFDLINPRTNKKANSIKAKTLFDLIVSAAWHNGDPGLIFLDEINRKNSTPGIGSIEATNPCGELPLYPYESCNLASINLSKMVEEKSLDWDKLKEIVRWGIRFLDNVIEVTKFPLSRIKEITFANRKIGLGVMGFADMLVKLGIPYNSTEAVSFARRLMRFIHEESLAASSMLAEDRGVFPNFKKSIYKDKNLKIRNATVNTVAPSGTISIIVGCSSGIEPIFAISFKRDVLSGTKLFEIHPVFEKIAKEKGIYSEDVLAKIARRGSLQKIKKIPTEIKRIFVTAFDVSPAQHLKVQAAFQEYTDNSVSKTINLPHDATVDDVKKIYSMAYRLKCKGITIYRYGSKKNQVLSFDWRTKGKSLSSRSAITADSEYSGGCISGECPF
jgi:ribonucleoside-diphosphate reductase alpha chain